MFACSILLTKKVSVTTGDVVTGTFTLKHILKSII